MTVGIRETPGGRAPGNCDGCEVTLEEAGWSRALTGWELGKGGVEGGGEDHTPAGRIA